MSGDSQTEILMKILNINDVSWNNPTVSEMPSLARLARAGVMLDTAYTLPVCSPSRAALLTGIYPFKYGFQVLSFYTTNRQRTPNYKKDFNLLVKLKLVK